MILKLERHRLAVKDNLKYIKRLCGSQMFVHIYEFFGDRIKVFIRLFQASEQ